MSLSHIRVTCDNCGVALQGIRYKCLRCADFDLCQACHDGKLYSYTNSHKEEHPFQALLDGNTLRIHYGRQASLMRTHAQSFTCPFCGKMGFSEGELVDHANDSHLSDSKLVICPICVAVPDANPDRVSNLAIHLRQTHRRPGSQLHSVDTGIGEMLRSSAYLNRSILRGNVMGQRSAREGLELFLSNVHFDDDHNTDNNNNFGAEGGDRI